MNCNVTINWKTIAAAGVLGVAWILAYKMEREDAKEILSGMVMQLQIS